LAIVVANPVDWELEDGESEAVGAVIIVVVAGKKKWRKRKAIVGNIILKYE
jgi:hypothetical protein